jgi:hypothetical protein
MCPACSHALPHEFLRHGHNSSICNACGRQGLCTALLCRPSCSGGGSGGLPLSHCLRRLARRAILLPVACILQLLAVPSRNAALLLLSLLKFLDDPAVLQEVLLMHLLRILRVHLESLWRRLVLYLRCMGFEPPGERSFSSKRSTSFTSSSFVTCTCTCSTTCSSPAQRTTMAAPAGLPPSIPNFAPGSSFDPEFCSWDPPSIPNFAGIPWGPEKCSHLSHGR